MIEPSPFVVRQKGPCLIDSLPQLVAELRRKLPAPISMCHDALTLTNGELRKAYDIVVEKLTNDLVERTGISSEAAAALLISTRFDLERAFVFWQRENPGLKPEPNEKLASGLELAAQVPLPNSSMRRYAHVIPRSNGYEVRLITHVEKYTEESFGFDYDYAMQDPTTRVRRIFVDTVSAAISRLASWDCPEDRLVSPNVLDSCLINSPIDAYLELDHLQLDDPVSDA